MPYDKIDQLYDALKKDGAVSKSREYFRSKMLAPGKEGYHNRLQLYNALKADGAIESPTYEEFGKRLGLHAVNTAPAPKPQQQKPQATAPQATAPAQQKPYVMSEQDKIRLQLQMGQMKQQVQQGIYNTNAKIGRMMQPLTPKGRERRRSGELQARVAGTPTSVVGFRTAPQQPAQGGGNGAGAGAASQDNVHSEQSPQPYGVVYENGKAKTQWVLADGSLTTSLAEANQAEYEARTARLARQFQDRMKENGLDPNKTEDVQRQAQLDAEAPMRKVLEEEWQRAEAEDRAADEQYRKDKERAENGSFWDRLKNAITTPLGPDGMPLRKGEDAMRDIHREAKRQDTFNLDHIAKNVFNNLPQAYKEEQILNYSRYFREHQSELKGRSVAQAAKDALQNEVYQATHERAVKANMPKSKSEFFMRKVMDQPFFSQNMSDKIAARTFSKSNGTETAEMDAMGRYGSEHRALDITGTIFNMGMDPTVYFGGYVGSVLGKQALKLGGKVALKGAAQDVAERYVGRTLAGRMAAGMAAGSANFGTFEGLKNIQQQMRIGGTLNPETGEYEFSAGDMLKATGHGMLLGSVTGTLSPVLGNVSDKLVKATEGTAGKVGIRAGELMTSTVAEGTIFATPELIENAQLADNDPNKRKAMDIWTDNMAMMLGFKLSHGIKSAPQVIAGLRPVAEPKNAQERMHNNRSFVEKVRKQLDASPRDLDFTKDEREELQRNGYGDLASLFTRTPKQPSKPKPKAKAKPISTDGKVMYLDDGIPHAETARVSIPEFDGYETMERLMQDPNVSQSARAKAYYILTGRMLPMGTITGYSTLKDETGITVRSMTADGQVVTSRKFDNEADAKNEEAKIRRQSELNSIDVGERYKEASANQKVVQAAIEEVAPGADLATVMRNYKAVKEGDKDAIASYGEMMEQLDKAIEKYRYSADNERPEAIRESIKEQTGIDVDKAIRTEPEKRTEEEAAAVEDYIKRLFPEQASEEKPMSEKEAAAAEAYDQARLLWDKVEKGDADAKAEVDAITLRMQEAYQMCEDAFGADAEMRIAEINEDPWPLVNNPELSEDQQDAVLYYVNAKAAMEGVMDASNEAADGKRKEVEANVERHTHKDMGVVQPATMKVDDKPVYVVKGNVVMLPDGSGIDVRNSDQSIVICDAETGEYKFASPDQLFSLGEAIDPQTELDEAYANIQAEHEAALGGVSSDANAANEGGGQVEAPSQPKKIVIGIGSILKINGEEYRIDNFGDIDVTLRDGQGNLIQSTKSEIETKLTSGEAELLDEEKSAEDVLGIPTNDENVPGNGESVPNSAESVPNSAESVPQLTDDQLQQHNQQMLEQEQQRKEEEANRQSTALERVPINEETGEPMFEKADRETALDALNEVTGGNDENTTAIVRAQVEQATKALEALKKKEPTKKAPSLKGSPMAMVKAQQEAEANYNTAMEEYNAQVAAAEENLNAWSRINSLMNDRKRAIREQQEAERKVREEKLHAEAVARLEEDKRIAAEKAAEQEAVGIHAVNPKIKAKWDGATKVEGNPNAITLADGSTIRGHYVLTEAGAATASHDVNKAYEPTEGFPIDENGESVNDRDYKRDRDAQRIVRDMADNYDSRALQTPVIVSKDGVVLSGNNRTMSGEIAAKNGTDKAYVEHLREFGSMFGFTPEQIDGMQHPRVVFVPDEELPYDASTFARFNAEQQKKQSKPEHAVKLGKIVPDNVFASIVGDISRFDRMSDYYADGNAVSSSIGQLLEADVINEMQLPELRTGNALSAAGKELIENTLIGKVFQASPDAVRQIISTPTLRQSVVMGLNEISNNRTLAKSDYDLSKELAAAVDLVNRAKSESPEIYKEGMPVSPYGRQQGLFDDEYGDSRVTDGVTLILADILNSGKPSDLRKFLSIYNNEAASPASGQLDMFSGGVTSKEELLNRLNEYFRNATPKEQQAIVDASIAERKQRAEAVAQNADGFGRDGEEPTDIQGESNGGVSEAHVGLNDDEANELLSRMEDNTSEIPQIELNPTNWIEQFGENGMVSTPLGKVKMGENQIAKLFEKGRSEQFGMIKPTLEHPHVIVEVPSEASDGNTERASSLLFIKTFNGTNGKKVYYFKSVTVKKDGLEVSVSSHYDRAKRVKEALKKGKLLYRFDGGAQTERHPADVSVTTSPKITQGNDNMVRPEPTMGSNANTDTAEVANSPTEVAKGETVDRGGNSSQPISSLGKVINKQLSLQENGEKSSENEGEAPLSAKIEAASAEVNTEPTEAQKEAGNYKKGHVQVGTFDITIEQPQGSVRKGTDANGKQWESKMNNTYGYIRGAVGVDGDHIDVFLSNDIDGWNGRKVFVVDQYNPDGSFDEHKVMLGFNDADEAKGDYLANYENGWEDGRKIVVSAVNLEDFEKWIASSKRKTKAFGDYSSVKNGVVPSGEGESVERNEVLEYEKALDHLEYVEQKWVDKIQDYVSEHYPTQATTSAESTSEKGLQERKAMKADPVLKQMYAEAKKEIDAADEMVTQKYSALPEDLRQQKAVGKSAQPPTREETILRDVVIEHMKGSGLDVIGTEDGQRVLDMANEADVRFGAKQKRALETATIAEQSTNNATVVSSADGAKVQKILETLADNYEKRSNKTRGFITDLSRSLGLVQHEASQYGTFETRNGKLVTIRVSNHNARVSFFDENGEEDGISIVISSHKNKGVLNDGKAHLVEYFYPKQSLERSGGKPLADIVKCVSTVLESGKFEDTTGLAQRQEVNAQQIREHRVYHGSGAEFDAFDHSHMGEGEGSQSFGWGTYVTNSETIGKSYANRAKADFGLKRNELESDISRAKEQLPFVRGEVKEELEAKIRDWETKLENFDNGTSLYTVEIPEDNGKNYLDWRNSLPDGFNKEAVKERIMQENRTDDEFENEMLERDLSDSIDYATTGMEMYKAISLYIGDKAASKMLYDMGFVGIKYPAGSIHGGVKEGDTNYVIFNEKDAQITDHVRFFRTANGEAYGFTIGGKIYINPKVATSETPVHEYAHLWATALKACNPKEWQNVVSLMKGTSVWDEVKSLYSELKSDDEIADEVLATYSGRRGAERLREEQRKIAKGNGGVFEKAEAISALDRVKRALKMFWKGVADFLHIHYTSAEDVADRVMKDLLDGVDPRSMMNGGNSLRPDTEINVVEGTKEHGFKNYAEAKDWAKEQIARTYSSEETGGKGDIRISNAAINKYLSQSAVDKSDSKDVHLSVLKVLPDVIRESVDAEQHADYKKGEDGVRSAKNGINPNVTIHRLYGAVRIDGKVYRVKVTLKENTRTKETPKAYSYEATKIELLEGSFSQTEGSHNLEPSNSKSEVSAGQHGNVSGLTSTFPRYSDKSITAAKLLNGVEKSYGGGKFFEDYNRIREQFIGEQGAERADHAEEVSTRLDNLSVAREMEADKKDAKAIKMATGWERGADGKWRYEIADMKEFDRNGNLLYRKHHPDYARYIELQDKDLNNLFEDGEELTDKEREEYEVLSKKYESDKFGGEKLDNNHTLEAYVDAPELFKAYPELKDVGFRFENTGGNEIASYRIISNVFDVDKDDVGEIVVNTGKVSKNTRTREVKSAVLHEMQHAIQEIEGFARGGSPKSMQRRFEAAKKEWRARAWADALRDKADEMGEHYNQVAVEKALIDEYKEMGMDNEEWMPDKETRMKGFNYFARGYADRSMDADIKNFRLNESTRADFSPYVEYTRLGGEVESRNVEHRMNMTPEERRASLAAETEDVSREDQIFLFGNNEGGSYSLKDGSAHLGRGKNVGEASDAEGYTAFANQYGVDAEVVKDYASGMKTGNLQKAEMALAEIRRTMRVANRGMKLSEFGKLFRPVQKELTERYGDIEKLRQEYIDAVMRERGVMEAARKRAEEEEAKRKAHLEEMSLLTTEELDKRYFDAIENGDDATAREMLDEAARRKGYDDTESDYQGVGAWSAPENPGYESDKARRDDLENSGSTVNLEDIALGYTPQPDDYFYHPEYYSMNTPHGLESVKVINAAIDAIKNGEEGVKVKVYRAVPTSVKEGRLRNGDWVTPSKKYAEMHGNGRLEGKYRIIEDEVPASELWWDGNDGNEWGFDDGRGYKYKNVEHNRKLNDLVTRDDNGEIIPPSKRFDENVEDVRYRESEPMTLKGEEALAALENDSNAMVDRVTELSERLHTPVRIIRTEEEVAALPSARQRRMKGSFNPLTGEVTIVVPNNANMADIENTFVHEVVGHDGLRVLFPDEAKLNNALDELYRVSNEGIQQTIDRMAQKMYDAEVDRIREKKRKEHEAKGEDTNASYYADMAEAHAEASKKREQFKRDATEEYGADLAGRIGEKGFEQMSAEELTFWGKLKAMLQKALQKLLDGLKIPGKRKWGDKDWAFVLHEAYKRKKNGGKPNVFDAADTEVMRRKTGFGDTKFSDGKNKSSEPKPIGHSTFGSVYNQFKGKVLQAVKFLVNHESGDLLGVFHRNDVGDIDMVWGNEGGGLCHILNKHINDKDFPTVKDLVSRIEDIINKGEVDERHSNADKLVLVKDGYLVTIRRNVREKGIKIADKNWVLTAYNKDAPATTKAPVDGTYGSTAVAPGTSSDAKLATKSEINEFSDNNVADEGIMFRDGDMGLEETITKMKVEASQANADNWQAKQDAMRAIGGNLNKLRQAMARQRAYDLSTVKSITDLAKVLLENGLLDDLSKYETKRILSAVNNVHGKQDVSDYVQKVMDIMVDNQLRMGANQLGKLLSIRGSRVDARGIEVQGQLDPEGQRIAQVVRKATSLPKENIEERIADCTNRMSSDDNAVAEEAAIEYSGLLLAHQFVEDITESKAEEKALRESIKEAKADLDAGTMEADAYREYVESTNDAIRQNKIERAEAYRSIVEQVGGVLGGSVERAKAWREAEKQRVETIHHNANSDMTGRPNDEHHKESKAQKIANNSIVRFVLAPLGTFDQMLRMFGKKSVNGEGYLWNRYMRGWVEATEKEYTGYQNALKTLDEKVCEVFDKNMKWGDLFSLERNLPKATVTFWDGGEQKAHELTQGNLLYIYMVDKMADGRMKLRRMGITEEDVENIKEFVDPRFLELADWMQDEFLVEKRNEYNEVHKRMFGASMAAIENYFPLKILANARIEEVDVADDTTDTALPATSTGSIIKRRRNNLALDVMGADAFSVILDHIQQMERWASFAEFNRDLNTLLSYKRFRNQVMNMTSVYGGGKTLWKNFRNVCSMAAGAYRPPIAALDKAAVNVAKGVTAAKVSFRVFTALKQFLSMPAYLSDSSPVYLAGNIANPIGAWKWSMENLPLFEKRWKSRMAGDPRLMKSEMDWKMWQNRAVEIASRIGMSPNAFVDALTVAIGAHSMYQTKKKKYLRYGYDEETAEKRAKQDATILFNQTQQSSESAFLSTMQTDRSWLSVLFTVFRNSSMSYTRQLYDALRNLKHRFEPGYKGLTEEYLAKQMRRDGIDPDKADQNAKSEYRRSLMRDIVRVGVFGYLLQFAWNLGAYLPYLLLGDDKDEKSDMWHDIFCHTMFGSIEGLTGGDVMSAVGNGFAKGEGLNLFSASKDMPLSSDLQNIVNKWNKDKVAAMNDVTNLMVQSGIGVNPQSLTDAVVAIMDYCGDDANTSRECALLITRIINCPQSQIDKIYFDELNATAAEAKGMTPAEIAERYARYKMMREAPLTGWMRSAEKSDSISEKKQQKVFRIAKEKLNSRMETEETKQLLSDYDAVAKQETALSKIKKTDRAAYREGMKQLRQSNDMRQHMRLKRYKHDMNELTSKYLRCKSAKERDSIVSTMFSTRAKMLEDIGRLKQQ